MGLFNKRLGGSGERYAEQYLCKKGFRILTTNFRTPYGELDIICLDDTDLVFVEVKTRKSDKYGSSVGAITRKKRSSMVKSALYYINQIDFSCDAFRFDVLGVSLNNSINIYHIENAFDVEGDFSL